MGNFISDGGDTSRELYVSCLDEWSIWSAPFGLRLLENIHYRKNMTVLDIGFGTGFPLTELAMRLGKSCRIYGIDPWEDAVSRTRNKLKVYGIENVDIYCCGAEQIPLPDQSADLITSNNGLNNVDDFAGVVGECARISKTGTQFIHTMNLDASMKEFYDIMEDVLHHRGHSDAILKMKEHIHRKRKPLDEVLAILTSHGFRIQNVVHDQFAYIFNDGTTMFEHFFVKVAFLVAWKGFLPDGEEDEILELVKQKIDDQCHTDIFRLQIPFVVIDAVKE
jgi:arsenite methyltransferase